MTTKPRNQTGLKLGLISLAVVALVFVGVFLFGPAAEPRATNAAGIESKEKLLAILSDTPTRNAIEALRATAPATYAQLETEAGLAKADGASTQDISGLALDALFSQFQAQALALRSTDSASYQSIISGLSDGFGQMKAADSNWCEGASIAGFLTQNDDELVPALLAEFPYGSPQYVWAMDWMATVLAAAKQGQDTPQRHQRPGFRDEAVLQQEGLALGSEQWALALQIAAFANSEGTSYGQMQEVIAGIDVCDLGIAVETVSARLPSDVRARIWADLMPEIMVGNTPYVMWRVTDYFFIG